ncbi:MAG: hypothetical protein A2Z66_13160 [Chloroflexi bacterium RBG_13_66_10]|nr:MAG: hypothetical protein A2Z66_13160 [Chloroflexi bacterium RBG_13_66_10]
MARPRLRTILLANLLVLFLIESLIRAAAGLGWVSLPSSRVTGFDHLLQGDDPPAGKRLYAPDRHLIVRLRPHARIVYKRFAIFPGARKDYEVRTNALGFRAPEFQARKAPGVFRILCLGDSSTFGMNVEAEDAYPQILNRLLKGSHPGRFEVLNLGVPGYTSRQGLELIRQEALRFEPDLVIFAYGTNDRLWWRPISDDELIRLNQSLTGEMIRGAHDALDRLYLFRLLQRMLVALIKTVESPEGVPGGMPRVPIEGIADAIETSYRLLARRGVSFLVLNTNFMGTDATTGIEMGVGRHKIDYFNMEALLGRVRAERSRHIERALGLSRPQPPKGTFLMRVQAPPQAREVILEYEFGLFLMRGGTRRMAMHDDGRKGDQVAGDGLWSVLVPASPGRWMNYFFWERRNGKLTKEFQDAYPPANSARHAIVPASGVGEIDTFGDFHLFSDSAHPSEQGHRIIARALYDHLMGSEAVKTFLARR